MKLFQAKAGIPYLFRVLSVRIKVGPVIRKDDRNNYIALKLFSLYRVVKEDKIVERERKFAVKLFLFKD